ncbi:hypothetical protein HOP54_21945 [Halomonas daqingensis]|uniref:Uncharacterized protein n=1 Tax=Billgrantia desiderata TaxID=52021 RepID=A0ABS9BCQ9_9GAMM|nr:DUF6746 family protein [Halomonas desiderata]MCE8031353.1 hypothetical protein [Halomonas desiderata]MCE8044999.1 hypothetical protein [Halomonas desiderata]MCE8049573.1 hypothetical protein [Halomonas desiderata]SEG21519.1 hypothetical protein SAMN04487953_11817 [Halomonas desiderata]
MKPLLSALLVSLMSATAVADSTPAHFKGEPADTLAQAVANFSEYNQRLAELLAQDELAITDLGTVHELTYTLENALEKIQAEVDAMADTLEEVHQGSETGDVERVKRNGATYLEAAQTLVP